MGSGPSSTTTSSGVSSPWAPAQPALQSILSQLGSLPTTPSGAQTSAASNLVSAASGVPNFGGAGTNTVNSLLSGGGAAGFSPYFSSAYNTLSNQLSPIANQNNNPYNNPAISQVMNQMNQGITSGVNSTWDAAGLPGSPGQAKALGMGLSQGDADLLLGQYNTNVGQQTGAASTLNTAGNALGTNLLNTSQTGLTNQLAGLTGAGSIPGLLTQPATTQLGAANTQANLPVGVLGSLESILNPIAALGGQTSGTSTTQTSLSPLSTILGGLLGFGGLLGSNPGTTASGGTTGGSGLLGLFSGSDIRMKEDIEPVGMLFDTLPIYSFKYKGDDVPRIGLMAQDVEKVVPEAVVEGPGGYKYVQYDTAIAGTGLLKLAA